MSDRQRAALDVAARFVAAACSHDAEMALPLASPTLTMSVAAQGDPFELFLGSPWDRPRVTLEIKEVRAATEDARIVFVTVQGVEQHVDGEILNFRNTVGVRLSAGLVEEAWFRTPEAAGPAALSKVRCVAGSLVPGVTPEYPLKVALEVVGGSAAARLQIRVHRAFSQGEILVDVPISQVPAATVDDLWKQAGTLRVLNGAWAGYNMSKFLSAPDNRLAHAAGAYAGASVAAEPTPYQQLALLVHQPGREPQLALLNGPRPDVKAFWNTLFVTRLDAAPGSPLRNNTIYTEGLRRGRFGAAPTAAAVPAPPASRAKIDPPAQIEKPEIRPAASSCSRCGYGLSQGVDTCSACGAEQGTRMARPPTTPRALLVAGPCPKCGHAMSEGITTCSACGAPR